jgi:hypothetical protein
MTVQREDETFSLEKELLKLHRLSLSLSLSLSVSLSLSLLNLTFMLNPDGESHSKRKMEKAEA